MRDLTRRVQRIEEAVGGRLTGCPRCDAERGKTKVVIVGWGDEPEPAPPCPVCGREPEVIEVKIDGW